MSPAEWILAGGEVLFDDSPDGSPQVELQALLNRHGIPAIVAALRDAADAAGDHMGEGNGGSDEGPADAWTCSRVDRFRVAIREALEAIS